jgi:hypothetical protein
MDSSKHLITTDCSVPRGFRACATPWLLAASLSAVAGAAPMAAMGQAAPPQPPPQQSTPAAPQRGLFPSQPPPTERPGFVYAFGRWWDTARGKLGDLTKHSNDAARDAASATQDAMQHAAQATRDAATAIGRLPSARFIEVHERCAIAPNGAPDCRTAAANACRIKGFTGGHPVDVQSAENCPPAVWMSGQEPAAGECPEETVVLMAACD